VLYANGEWEEQDHDVKERQRDVLTDALLLDRKTDIDRFVQTYSAGANWYPTRTLNMAAKYTYKDVDGDYDNKTDSTDNSGGDRYPAYTRSLDTKSQHAYARVSWRPLARLRSAVRYDFRITDYDTKYAGLSDKRSGRTRTHSVGAETTWTPIETVYLHGNINYVSSETETPASDLIGAANRLVTNFDNDYFTSTLSSGWSVTKKLDLEARYFFYKVDNYKNNSAQSQPYGAKLEEHGVSAGLKYHVRENMTWTAKYAYFHSDDDLSGGFNDYRANVIVIGIEANY
jgi:outer membrane receptor for ferrienterochelin and colicin